MIEIQAPNNLEVPDGHISIFLAGSIELGVAELWQQKIIEDLKDENVVLFNPRRSDWDSSWKQEKGNTQFREQVEWELNALEKANLIVMYFDPNTKSPISLLELGLHAREQKMVVLCPKGFWRKGNVDIVCEKYGVKQVESFEELIEFIKKEYIHINSSLINQILEEYPDETFLKADGFDEAIIGVENYSMRLIYSVKKCIEILMRDMSEEDALEYFMYNISGAYMGEKTPILCYDNFDGFL